MKISSKEYINNQIGWLEKLQESEVNAIREAVKTVAKTNADAINETRATNNQKFEAQNEWRQQFKDQTGVFLTRREFWTAVLAIILALAALYFKK